MKRTTLVLSIVVTLGVAVIAMGVWPYLVNFFHIGDPNGIEGFNRYQIREYAFGRASEKDKRPIIIEDVSPTQKVTLHGETLLVSLVLLKGYGLFNDHLYFVTKPGQNSYLSGGADLVTEIDDIGWDREQEKIKIAQERDKAVPTFGSTLIPTPPSALTPTPTSMSEAERKQMEEGWELFREKEKAEEEKRKQALDKAAREARGDSSLTPGKGVSDVAIGAKPAPQ